MTRAIVIGIDSSTQSTKVLAVDLETGEEVGEARAFHSGEDTQDPRDWWAALQTAIPSAIGPDMEVRGISVAGQQHGLVTLDSANDPVRPAPLWNNVDAAPDADRLNGLADFTAEVGSHLVASFTIAKLAHFARTAPDDLVRTVRVALPHDYLNLRLTGELTTDRGEASGSGWWSASPSRIRRDLLALAVGNEVAQRLGVPVVRGPDEIVGHVTSAAANDLRLPAGIPVAVGSGDNAAAAVGVGSDGAEIVISLGTSGTAYVVSDTQTHDSSGGVAGFADATGRFLPLACMINCTRVLDSVTEMFGVERGAALDGAARLAPGAEGLLFVPYLAGERTPNLPGATGSILGLTPENLSVDLMIRAAVDGVAAGLAYLVDALARLGLTAPLVTLVGGGSRHPTWQQAIADATGLPVSVRGGGEHTARGAAIQAAAIVRGERVRDVAAAWRPPVIAEIVPRLEHRDAFRLPERRALIVASDEKVSASL